MTKEGRSFRDALLKLPCFEDVDNPTAWQTIVCDVCGEEFQSASGNVQSILCDECREKLESLVDPTVDEVNELFIYKEEEEEWP